MVKDLKKIASKFTQLSALRVSWLSISALDFILLGGTDISWNTEIKFLSINWNNFAGYLVSWGGGSSFNFHYQWNFKRTSNLQQVSPKL